MNYPSKMYMFCLLTLPASSLHAGPVLKKIANLFSREPHVEIVQRSLPFSSTGSLRIINKRGNIYIKTEWNQNSVFLTAQKHAPTMEQLPKITIKDSRTPSGELCIETVYAQDTTKGSVDYILIVPERTHMQLTTQRGSIKIKKAQGPIIAQTTTGDITIHSAHKNVCAQVHHKGDITIHNAYEQINAVTNRGKITLNNTHKDITAHCTHGAINVQATKIPSTCSIELTTDAGNIQLQTPKSVHADVKAHTAHGTLYSNHHITIKPFTTQLDGDAWKKFKQEIDGTIGSGEALIALNTKHGSIKMLRDMA